MNDLDRYLIESVALKHDHGGLTPADDGLPAGLAAGNIIAHTGTGPVLGVIRAVSAECLVQRSGVVATSKDDWTVGADCWVDDATGAWTETAQPDPDLWVGRAVTNDSIAVQRNDPNAEWPWTAQSELFASVSQPASPGAGYIRALPAARDVSRLSWIDLQLTTTFPTPSSGSVEWKFYGRATDTNPIYEYIVVAVDGSSDVQTIGLPLHGLSSLYMTVENTSIAHAVTTAATAAYR